MREAHVSAALIEDGGRFLICQRPAHKACALLWEFVGGKREPGETGEEALVRECREELGVTVKVGDVFAEATHDYPDLTVHLTVYRAAIAKGEPTPLEHHDIRWITVPEIPDYTFCPADLPILYRLAARRPLSSAEAAIRAALSAQVDPVYREFSARLMPTIDAERVLGVRMPDLRKAAAAFAKTPDAAAFCRCLPHAYYEENNVHACLIERMTDYAATVEALNTFLPYVDNWATCDMLSPRAFKKHPQELPAQIRCWLLSTYPYTVRFGIGMLMKFYLDDAFDPQYFDWVAAVTMPGYYVDMMIAWYFATALAKQYDAALPYLTQHRLSRWVHNKTIQKAIESYRVSPEHKAYLRTLRRKDEPD
ncbi:MAG: NUDIX domain-containing protein [Clostridia bacterium]|nr:NUDIX domain-containing protein [Clostridia bacterium]